MTDCRRRIDHVTGHKADLAAVGLLIARCHVALGPDRIPGSGRNTATLANGAAHDDAGAGLPGIAVEIERVAGNLADGRPTGKPGIGNRHILPAGQAKTMIERGLEGDLDRPGA